MNEVILDDTLALAKLRKLPFSKSWQNSFVSRTKKNIINRHSGAIEQLDLDVFVFIPANTITQAWMNDREFLTFRREHRFSHEYDFKLLADREENNNRRLAIRYAAQFFNAAEIEFLIDDNYTLYISGDELQKLSDSEDPARKSFYNSLCVPKHFGGRKGAEETWSH